MGIYDFQEATASRIAEIFREATIDENGNEKLTGGQRRVLLADEVGLGKTHVAASVIEKVRELRKAVNDDMFRVVYVCSNLSIANQNISKLGVGNKARVGESRLSMQHLTIRENYSRNEKKGDSRQEIIPLTPSTSFSLRGHSFGNVSERALITVILLHFDELNSFKKDLIRLFQGKVGNDSWRNRLGEYESRVKKLGPGYIKEIKACLNDRAEFIEIKNTLLEAFKTRKIENIHKGDITNSLRRIFADVSLSMLNPDLIIMDEFQRFSSLLDYNDESEQSAIVKKFFEQEGGKQPMILLLSATPYKPYSTLEELTEYNNDEHYEDFNRLMGFLFNQENSFSELWSDYSCRLSHLKTEKFDVLLASKKSAEDKMYEGICRTERLNEGLLSTRYVSEIPVDSNDILSYCEMQKIIRACKSVADRLGMHFHWSNMPVEYVKSSPYLLSFMESYELKKQIAGMYRRHGTKLPRPSELVLLRERDIKLFRNIPLANARLKFVHDMLMPERKGAEFLLWVPASIPYYRIDDRHPFAKNRDFSKVLVFSSWEMVPRMIAVMLSYAAERKVVVKKGRRTVYEKSNGGNRLRTDAKSILIYPSVFLADLYNPREMAKGRSLKDVRMEVMSLLTERLEGIRKSERRNYGDILQVLKWLDGEIIERPTEMPANTVSLLTDMTIGGPGVCLYRILRDSETAKRLAEGFLTLFNRRAATSIVDNLHNERDTNRDLYLDRVMDYCVNGNLQAVLDEYFYMCGNIEDFEEKMADSFITETTFQIDTNLSFDEKGQRTRHPKQAMRALYAVPFSSRKTLDEKGEKRSNNIRTAFQSPFYPFVVASTSVGQEGLDFHWYCRKIVHWNLPSNPQDLEQREGRINRYKCLAIRRNIAKRFSDIYDWAELFRMAAEKVESEFGDKYSQIVPNWCLPTEWISGDCKEKTSEKGEPMEWIERIVPQYPLSSDVARYNRLKDVLSLYRLTLGQPRQEELVDLLASQNLTTKQISKLLFNLSPIYRKDKTTG